MKRRHWFNLHAWAGVQVSLLLCLVLITGTFAAISPDIDWLANPAIRATAPTNNLSAPTPWSEFLQQVQTQKNVQQIESLNLPADHWHNAEAVIIDNNGNRTRYYLNRYTGELTGDGRWYNWQRFFRQLHRHLMMPLPIGITLVCLMIIPLLISLISSFHIYKNWYRQFFHWPSWHLKTHKNKTPSPIRQQRHRWGELHRFVGLWSLWFIALMVITGGWYLLEQWGLKASYPPATPPGYQQTEATDITPRQLQTLVTEAEQLYPQLSLRQILLPAPGRPYISLRGQADALLVRNRANQVVLDMNSGELLAIHKGEQLNLHARIAEAADPLHFGTFLNGTSRWLWFLFGLLLSGLAITGVYLQILRLAAGEAKMPSGKEAFQKIWRGMTLARWPVIVILAISGYLAVDIFVPGY